MFDSKVYRLAENANNSGIYVGYNWDTLNPLV